MGPAGDPESAPWIQTRAKVPNHRSLGHRCIADPRDVLGLESLPLIPLGANGVMKPPSRSKTQCPSVGVRKLTFLNRGCGMLMRPMASRPVASLSIAYV